jgi:hypothetical protein
VVLQGAIVDVQTLGDKHGVCVRLGHEHISGSH